SNDGFPLFFRCINDIRAVAPMLAVKGDWDIDAGNAEPFSRAGLEALNGNHIVNIRGAKLCIVGVDSGASCRAALDAAPKWNPTILIYHSPGVISDLNYNLGGVDLFCCGHTHGGQIALPFYGALITQAATQREYASGLHRVGQCWVYTNRGIGMEGHFPRVRFCAKPELTVFNLIPAGDGAQSHIETNAAD
ncbi:MAG: hypothetical protein ACRD3W_28470, partial [Terriglobales bacterium]